MCLRFSAVVIRAYAESDRVWAEGLLNEEFGGPLQCRRGEVIDVLALSGLVAEKDARPVGLLTYQCEAGVCEIAFIAAVERHQASGARSWTHCGGRSWTASGCGS
jgi:hypothetical protein